MQTLKINVTLTTEDGEVLEMFVIKKNIPSDHYLVPEDKIPAILLSQRVRDYIEHRFEVEDK